MTEVKLPILKLINYLKIAAKQRERAAKKFVEEYGPSSGTVAEVNGELGELQQAINELLIASVTPIEQHIQKEKANADAETAKRRS